VSATLRLELFVESLQTSLDFYVRVLGFEALPERPGGYTPLANGAVQLALNRRADLDENHPLCLTEQERPGRGVEIVLEVDDVEKTYAHVTAQGWPRSAELLRRPWGLTDFRVTDPDGYYWRVTSRS
jgi:uncharacterized glyoxalase superfamily protein PhnB